MPHTIRLAGPWQMTADEVASRVLVPCALPESAVVLERTFNRPANLGDDTKLFLRFVACGRLMRVLLDGEALCEPTAGDLRHDVSGRLSRSPRVRVEVSAGETATFQPASLEIVEPWDEWDDDADAA